jgi:long-subunit fatty acid transport protein
MRSRRGARKRQFQGLPLPRVTVHLLLPGLAFCFALVALVPLLLPHRALASGLLSAAAGSADAATGGSTIAEPLTPLGAQFANPAGLAGFERKQMGVGLGLAYGKGVVTADAPAGYQATNEVLVPFLETFLAVPRGRWTFGISSMGTSGARFDYGARPALGVADGFFSESGIFGVPIGAAYRLSDQWWIGAQIAPLYGSTHLRYSMEVAEFPGTPTRFRYTVSGFGVQGMLGVTWRPDGLWSLALSVKPPGRIWADGDTPLGAAKQDVNLELEAPTEVAFGVTRALLTKWRVSYGLRFIDTSALGTSFIRFEKTPSADTPFLPAARDEWRHAVGVEYAWSERLKLLGGFSKANAIVGRRGVSPSTYDTKDLRLSVGARWNGEGWILDGSFGYLFGGDRHIGAGEALVFPGKYDSKPAYLLLGTITRKF